MLHAHARLGFLLILEPFETDNATVPNPVFHFTCVSQFMFAPYSFLGEDVLTPHLLSNLSSSDLAVS
jgi:hypothetical protein